MKPLTEKNRLIINKISGRQIKEINKTEYMKIGKRYNVPSFENTTTFRFFKEEDVLSAVALLKKELHKLKVKEGVLEGMGWVDG